MPDDRYVNKVVYEGNTLIDISDTDIDEDLVPAGSVVYNKAGRRVVGSAIIYNVQNDTTENWNAKRTYVPERNDIIIYSDHGTIDDGNGNNVDVPGIKIGDGNAYLIDLPFLGEDDKNQILQEVRSHTGNSVIHVTSEDKNFWDNKLNCEVVEGNLIFNRS